MTPITSSILAHLVSTALFPSQPPRWRRATSSFVHNYSSKCGVPGSLKSPAFFKKNDLFNLWHFKSEIKAVKDIIKFNLSFKKGMGVGVFNQVYTGEMITVSRRRVSTFIFGTAELADTLGFHHTIHVKRGRKKKKFNWCCPKKPDRHTRKRNDVPYKALNTHTRTQRQDSALQDLNHMGICTYTHTNSHP